MSNLGQRVLVAVVGIPVLLAAVWFHDPWLLVLVAIVALVAAWEFLRLAPPDLGAPYPNVAYAATLAFVLDASTDGALLLPIAVALIAVALGVGAVRYRAEVPAQGWVWTVAAAMYCGLLLGHWLLLRNLPNGFQWVLIALLATFANDTAAYGVGRAIGRHKMAPAVSPGKTWEGAAGALVAASIAVPALAWLLGLGFDWRLLLLGPALSVAAQAGDLAESMLKRAAGVKDSSALIPGHGGLLDRTDALVFVGPLVYYYAVWIARTP